MSTAGHVAVAVDGAGKAIDSQTLTTTEDNSTTVYRQTVTLGDPTTYGRLAAIDHDGHLYVRADDLADTLKAMLDEMRKIRIGIALMGDMDL